jgi:hypothetical protein
MILKCYDEEQIIRISGYRKLPHSTIIGAPAAAASEKLLTDASLGDHIFFAQSINFSREVASMAYGIG